MTGVRHYSGLFVALGATYGIILTLYIIALLGFGGLVFSPGLLLLVPYAIVGSKLQTGNGSAMLRVTFWITCALMSCVVAFIVWGLFISPLYTKPW